MSIASEIERLQNAKSALKTAIEGKGVSVPASTKLDGYSALVDSIEQGGGGTDEDMWYIVVEHVAKYILEKDPYYNKWDVGDTYGIKNLISYSPNKDCWLEYKGEKYYVANFSNGAQITKQGSPQKFYNGDYNTIFITPTATEGVYSFLIYDD